MQIGEYSMGTCNMILMNASFNIEILTIDLKNNKTSKFRDSMSPAAFCLYDYHRTTKVRRTENRNKT